MRHEHEYEHTTHWWTYLLRYFQHAHTGANTQLFPENGSVFALVLAYMQIQEQIQMVEEVIQESY